MILFWKKNLIVVECSVAYSKYIVTNSGLHYFRVITI